MGKIFSNNKPYKSKYYSRSNSSKRGWETRRKNELKRNVTTKSEDATNMQMHDQLQWIFDQVGKDVRREWKDEYEYEDIVDVTLVMAKDDKAFSKEEFETMIDDFRTGRKILSDYL